MSTFNGEDYDYYVEADLAEYEGKYIAIHNNEVQFVGDSLEEVYNMMRKKYPDVIPFITQVCPNQAMLL